MGIKYRRGFLFPTSSLSIDLCHSLVDEFNIIAYNRFSWADFEAVEGNYNFDELISWIDLWTGVGRCRTVSFGVMSTSASAQACPSWLLSSIGSTIQGSYVNPVWWDKTYLEYVDKFVSALFAAVASRLDKIEFIDMRFIGMWGEMRWDGFTAAALGSAGMTGPVLFAAYRRQIDSFLRYFNPEKLALNVSAQYIEIVRYAAGKGVCLRNDGLSTVKTIHYDMLYAFGNYGWGSRDDIYSYTLGAAIINTPSYGASGTLQPDGSYKYSPSGVTGWYAFRFYNVGLSIPAGADFLISFRMKYDVYDQHAKPIYVRATLMNSAYTVYDEHSLWDYLDLSNPGKWQDVKIVLSTGVGQSDATQLAIEFYNGDTLSKTGVFYVADLSMHILTSVVKKDLASTRKRSGIGDACAIIMEHASARSTDADLAQSLSYMTDCAADYVSLNNFASGTTVITENQRTLLRQAYSDMGSVSGGFGFTSRALIV